MVLPIQGRGTPQQAETEHLTDVEALALRIGASSARFIVLLENHKMEITDQLADDAPRKFLQAAKINRYYLEEQDEQEFAGRSNKLKLLKRTATSLAARTGGEAG